MSFFAVTLSEQNKLYKIAVVLTIKIKKYLCTHCSPLPITALLRASKCSKFGKVWLWSQLPHNTWSLVSQRKGGNEREERMKEAHPLSQSTLFIMTSFFLFMWRSTLSGNLRLQRHYSLFRFPCEKLNLKPFVFVAWVDSSYLFCSVLCT